MICSISILCFNKSDVTRKCLDSLEKTIPNENVEIIITNNGSTDYTEDVIFKSNLNNKVYVQYGKNLGFIKAHNQALNIARGHYFIALNNDMIMEEKDWLYKLLKPLEDDPNIMLVGLNKAPNSLKPDGFGFFGRELEYVDGACIAGRTADFLKYGLFSRDFEMFYCEDSDLSLRMRQMGFEITTVDIKHNHIRSATADTIDKTFRSKTLERNRELFVKKWKYYLRSKMFTNNILVKATSQGYGDIISSTPILEALRREHPTANIEVEGCFPDVFMNNPYVAEFHAPRTKYKKAYDRIIDLTLNYASHDLLIKEVGRVAGVRVENFIPQIFMSNEDLEFGISVANAIRNGERTPVVCCATQMARSKWEGRNWSFEYSKELISILEANGFAVIEVGKGFKSTGEASADLVDKTNLRELFSLVAASDMFIGIDSGPFHVAQAFRVPSFVIFGATEPSSRIVDFSNTFPIRDSNLPCIGCYMRKGVSNWNKCELRNEQCMTNITPEAVMAYVAGEIDPLASNIEYLESIVQRGYE